MLNTVKSYTGECNGQNHTIMVYYNEKDLRDSTYYVFEKSGYTPCPNCSNSDCPIYKSAPRHTQLYR